jgi:hypothetical protein
MEPAPPRSRSLPLCRAVSVMMRSLPDHEVPSGKNLVVASGLALLVALVLLITVVLPAEYNIDPLGTGAAKGLTAIASSSSDSQEPLPEAEAPVQLGPLALHNSGYKVDDVELALGPYEYIEYKYTLEKGASMLYSWTASSSLIHDMHGESEISGNGSAVSFEKRDRDRGTGALTAPFSGIHGWYWENPTGDKVTIRIRSAGFYSGALEIHSNRTRRTHELRSLDQEVGP